ncbi:glycosyl transferase, partial [Bisporella sp. PMI_857]
MSHSSSTRRRLCVDPRLSPFTFALVPTSSAKRAPHEGPDRILLHTVFPASDFFRILPVRKDILKFLLNCDLAGFHNPDYAEHFLQCCRKIMALEVSDSEVSYEGHTIRTSNSPIGIDPEEFRARLKEPKVQDRAKLLNEKYKDVNLVVSIDRLDYIKGIPLRLDAMNTFLTKHPEYAGKVVFLQVLIPSREDVVGYQHLNDNINERVSSIYSKFGDIEFSPVQLKFSSVSKDELTALYAASDAYLVSPTRDRFNIVCLEYITCQQDRHGVFLLSEFAGAAQVLEDCIKFNPWNVHEFSEAIFQALTMSEEEKRLRSDKLHSFAMANTSKGWGEMFIEELKDTRQMSKGSTGYR